MKNFIKTLIWPTTIISLDMAADKDESGVQIRALLLVKFYVLCHYTGSKSIFLLYGCKMIWKLNQNFKDLIEALGVFACLKCVVNVKGLKFYKAHKKKLSSLTEDADPEVAETLRL